MTATQPTSTAPDMQPAPDTPAPTYDALVARFVAEHPGCIAIARANIARWLEKGVQARQPLLHWDALLLAAEADSSGFQRLLDALAGRSTETRRLLEFSPFAGVLPRELRRQASDLCGYRH